MTWFPIPADKAPGLDATSGMKRLSLTVTENGTLTSGGSTALMQDPDVVFLVTNAGERVIKTKQGLWRVTADGDVVMDDPRGDEARELKNTEACFDSRFSKKR